LSRAVRSRLIPLAALVGMLASGTGCGPIKVNIGDVNLGATPRPGQSATPAVSPGVGSPLPATATPAIATFGSPLFTSPRPSPTPFQQGSLAPNATPTPAPSATASSFASVDPNASPLPSTDPNATPVPTAVPQPVASRGPLGPGANPSVKTFTMAGPLKPMGVGADSQGNAWVGMGQLGGGASTGTADLLKLGRDGAIVKTVKLGGPIQSVVVDRYDNAWVLHQSPSQFGGSGYSVTKVSSDGAIVSTLRVGTSMDFQAQLVIDNGPSGNMWLVEGAQKIDKISASGGLLGAFTNPIGGAKVAGPDAIGNAWLAGSSTDKNVFKLGSNGATLNSFHVADVSYSGQVACDNAGKPWVAMAPDPDGNMWLLVATSSGGGSVTKLGNKGDLLQSFPVGDYPSTFSFGGEGSIWATCPTANTVTRIGS
jgi:hypothetical protein